MSEEVADNAKSFNKNSSFFGEWGDQDDQKDSLPSYDESVGEGSSQSKTISPPQPLTRTLTRGISRMAKAIGGGESLETRIRKLSHRVEEPPPPAHCGWITKRNRRRGMLVDSWRRRYCKAELGHLRYFAKYDMETEEASNEKGSTFLSECFVEEPLVHTDPCMVYITLSTMEGQYEDHLIFKAEDEEEATLWRKQLRLHIEYANKLSKFTYVEVKGRVLHGEDHEIDEAVKREYEGIAPEDLHGWFKKEARGYNYFAALGSNTERYFVLSEGVLYYYVTFDEELGEPSGLKGTMILNDCTINVVPKKKQITIESTDKGSRKMVMTMIDDLSRSSFHSHPITSIDTWQRSLLAHIDFANLNKERIEINLGLMTNLVANFRDKSYAYTMAGMFDSFVNQISTVATNTAYSEFFVLLDSTYKFVTDDPLSNRVLGIIYDVYTCVCLCVCVCVCVCVYVCDDPYIRTLNLLPIFSCRLPDVVADHHGRMYTFGIFFLIV